MPFIRFKGFTNQFVAEISSFVVDQFSLIADVPKEKVKIELLHADKITDSPHSLEIMMFPRPQEKHDALASMLYRIVSTYGYENTHIFFILLNPSLYYKEGKPISASPAATALT